MTDTFQPFEIEGQDRTGSLVVTCDHASNHVPSEVNGGSLGISEADMDRHIAYDVGGAGVAHHLAAALQAPVILSRFSRLVIDPNRGEDDPTLIMQLYDGTMIPANRHLGPDQINWRLDHCYRPYHRALAALLDSRKDPMIVAVHTFTAQLAGRPKRPWHIGILHENDLRLAAPLLARLRREPDLCVGENEPYGGHLQGDSIDRHALKKNRPNVLIEIRNDLIRTEDQQRNWANRLAPIIAEVATQARQKEPVHG